ncbi:MAG: hypothetical protein ACRCTI_08605 [Beijerinckiaceae bacterium]
MTSEAFAAAARWEREARADFAHVREAAYAVAHEATNGRMLNRRAVASGVDPWDLFTHNDVFARAYASEELLEHWRNHTRPTFDSYQRATFPGLGD